MTAKSIDDIQDVVWQPPFMVDAGWIVTRPREASEVMSTLAEASRGQVRVAQSLTVAVARQDINTIRELQQQYRWPGPPEPFPSPEEVVSVSQDALERYTHGFAPPDQELEAELRLYGELTGRPPSFRDRLLAEEFLFMKSNSRLLAKTRRTFHLLRDRGKAILEIPRAALQRKRTFMSRFPDARFFVGGVVLVSTALAGPFMPVALAGGVILWFGDP